MKLFNAPVLKGTALACIMFCNCAVAQKLPSVQKEPMQAPSAVKIDGVPSEWDDAFKANNNATDFKYLIANDKDNLYIVIQTDYYGSAQKIVAGGITFTFSTADKKTQATLTYPVMPPQYSIGISHALRVPETTPDEITGINKQLTDHIKEIPVTGMADITDASISLYNDLGIKAAHHISDQRVYTLELQLPLKYLQTVLGVSNTFSYKMQVNGLAATGLKMIGGQSTMAPSDQPPVRGGQDYMMAPTYLNGSYTLFKQL